MNSRIREHLGLTPATRTIDTGSMKPLIGIGDRILVQRSNRSPASAELWVFDRGDIHICHRILWIRRDGSVLTKGDANLLPDGWIPRSKLFGPVTAIQRNGVWRPANRRRDRALGLAISLGMTAYLGTRRCGGLLLRRLGLRRP